MSPVPFPKAAPEKPPRPTPDAFRRCSSTFPWAARRCAASQSPASRQAWTRTDRSIHAGLSRPSSPRTICPGDWVDGPGSLERALRSAASGPFALPRPRRRPTGRARRQPLLYRLPEGLQGYLVNPFAHRHLHRFAFSYVDVLQYNLDPGASQYAGAFSPPRHKGSKNTKNPLCLFVTWCLGGEFFLPPGQKRQEMSVPWLFQSHICIYWWAVIQ